MDVLFSFTQRLEGRIAVFDIIASVDTGGMPKFIVKVTREGKSPTAYTMQRNHVVPSYEFISVVPNDILDMEDDISDIIIENELDGTGMTSDPMYNFF